MTGRIAERYRIVGLLGSGAMAEVYEVVDESRGAVLALKRLRSERSKSRTARILLQREYETLTQLLHPLIIRAYDYGVDGDLPFYTMERLVGRNVNDLAPLPWLSVASLLRDVASALSLVHSRKLVHRDVSSRNVCRTEDGRAKLIDFGALSPMGRPREIIGTPPFLCPEALELRTIDARSDLFSLGALAYFSLTGRHAYPARRVAELGGVWSQPVRPPSSVVPAVPASLDALILSLLDLNPLARPGSAAEVCDRLTAIAGLPTAEAPETARAYLLTPNLVARADETQRFRRRLLRAERRRGSSILVESRPGGGRSRLLSSFLLEARLRGAVVASADATHGSPTPFGVARALARSLADVEPGLSDELSSTKPELARILALDDASESEHATIDPEFWIPATEMVTRWWIDLSRKRTVVVGIDDVQACDGPSASIVAALATEASSESLLVVATSEAGSSESTVRRLRDSGYSLSLRPFVANETRELLSSVFGDVPHLDEVSGWVHRLCGGLPGTALELAQHLVDSGLARYGDGGWRLPPSLESLDLPDGVDAALDARIASLGEGARLIAEALSLTSDHDPLLVVEYVELLDERTKREIFVHLNELVSSSVLVDTGDSYVFSNREIRDAVRRRLPPEALPALHRRIAQAYCSGREPVNDCAAHHLFLAGDTAAAFQLMAAAVRDRSNLFARGTSFFRTAEAADTIERLYEWGREHAAPAAEMAFVSRGVMQLASLGNGRLAGRAPEILETLRRDTGLDIWQRLTDVADPAERIQRAIGEAYARYAAAPDREQRLDPGAAIQELGVASASIVGIYARGADQIGGMALDDLMRPLRFLSPALDVIGRLVELAARALRGVSTRELRVSVVEQTTAPVPGIDEASRVAIHLLSLYYLALEDTTQGMPVPDEQLSPLEHSASFAPLAWQARMLREYYRGNERKAEECRRRRDVAMTGRFDVDGHLETSVLYEASAYARLGDLMSLKRLLPVLEERSVDRPGWRPYYHLATGNCHSLRGDHASAAEEYERGLALPNIETHACRVLLVTWLARALIELGRHDAAREKVEGTIERDASEPLMPLYFEQLQIELARAEAGAGDVARALARARDCLARVEDRGFSGVVLVGFLVDCAVLAHQLGDQARFEELTQRVGKLVAGVDSTALATQYARLLQMRRSAAFEPVAPAVGGAMPNTLYTAVASNVRTELEHCHGASERFQRALEFLMTYSGAARGFLYLYRLERLDLVTSIPDAEPTETLDGRLNEWVSAAFDNDGMTKTASLDELSSSPSVYSFSFVELVTGVQGNAVLAGVAALEPSRGALSRVPNEILRAVSEELVRSGDATGKPLFAKSAG